MLNDRETIFPDVVGIEVLKIDNIYTSQFVLILDKDRVVFLPTDISEEKAVDACKKTVDAALSVWSSIAGIVFVFDSETNDVIDKINILETFPELQMNIQGIEGEEAKKFLH